MHLSLTLGKLQGPLNELRSNYFQELHDLQRYHTSYNQPNNKGFATIYLVHKKMVNVTSLEKPFFFPQDLIFSAGIKKKK